MPSSKTLAPFSIADAARAMHAAVDAPDPAAALGRVVTDSRALQPGETFLALRGETHDAHRFIPQALERGAAALVIDRHHYLDPYPDPPIPILRVADTLRAYGDLAAAWRARWGGPLLAITGSAGKTTTRRLVAAALARTRPTLEPIHNYNNLIGVPHTLLRLAAEHEIAVLELGMNQPGELERLAEIVRPDAALLTQIGRAHIGMFDSIEGLVAAKLELFRGCAPGVPLVVNAACARTAPHLHEFTGKHPVTAFLGRGERRVALEPAVTIENLEPTSRGGSRFDLVYPSGRLTGLELNLFGLHQVENVAAAAALLHAAGLDPAPLADILPDFTTEPFRGEIFAAGDWTFILDCYNAAPGAVAGAIDTLAALPHTRRHVYVLADMLELGHHSAELHAALLGHFARDPGPAAFFGLGREMNNLAAELARRGWPDARGFPTRDALIESLQTELRPGDVVLFKGAHSFGLEHAARALAPAALHPRFENAS